MLHVRLFTLIQTPRVYYKSYDLYTRQSPLHSHTIRLSMAAVSTVCLGSSTQPPNNAKLEILRRSVANFQTNPRGHCFMKNSQNEKIVHAWPTRPKFTTVCHGSSAQSSNIVAKPDIGRQSVAFPPSPWGEYFINLSIDEKKLDAGSERSNVLKKEVIKMLINTEGPKKLVLIDTLHHLGISYQFEDEIEQAVEQINSTYVDDASHDSLYTLALRFRLLRQNGFNAPSSVFDKFKEANGSCSEKLATDVMGLLSLYEASFVGTRDDLILDEASAFTIKHLRAALPNILDPLLGESVAHSLELPLHKRLQRLEARYFISLYEQGSSHNEVLLEFAKLDYNILQSLHQKEIRELAKWWKDLNLLGKMNFARDRLTECYYCLLGAYVEPQYSRARIFATKILTLTSVIDDLYDVYGNIDELQRFTDAVYRWDISAMESLPNGIKPLYEALINCSMDFKKELSLHQTAYRVQYLEDSMHELCGAFFLEAKWYYERYVPKFYEYLHCGEISIGYPMIIPVCFIGAGEVATKEAFEWMKSYPKYIQDSSRVIRILDDIQSTKFEQGRGHVVSAVQSYMNENNCSHEVAVEKLHELINLAWKDMNQACLRPTPFPMAIMRPTLDLARFAEIIYQFGDGYTFPDRETKENINALLVDQIPA